MATTRVTPRGEKPPADDEFLQQLYRGGELLAAGKVIEAKDYLERAHRLQPKNEKGQNLLGLAYFKLGLFDRAAELYEMLVRDNPVDPTLRVNLGLVYLKTNALQRAMREFETATELAPDHQKAHNYLGLALAQLGEYGRAREHFLKAGSDAMAEKMSRAIAGEGFSRPPPEQPAKVRGFAEIEGTDVVREQGGELVGEKLAPAAAPRELVIDVGSETPAAVARPASVPATPPTPLPRQALPPAEGDWNAQFGFDDAPPRREPPAAKPAAAPAPVPRHSGSFAAIKLPGASTPAAMPPAPSTSAASPPLPSVPAPSIPPPSAPVRKPGAVTQTLGAVTQVLGAVQPATPVPTEPSTKLSAKAILEEELRFAEDEGPSYTEDEAPRAPSARTAPSSEPMVPWPSEGEAKQGREAAPEAAFEETSEALAASVPLAPVSLEAPAVLVQGPPSQEELEAQAEAAAESAEATYRGAAWRHDTAVPLLRELAPSVALAGATPTNPFVVGSGSFSVRVDGELLTRLEGLVAFSGKLTFQPEQKRFRGRATDKPFGEGPRRLVRASGKGVLYLEPPERRTFTAVDLGDETAYLRDECVFAFEEPVMFENGRVPSDGAADLDLVHLRGQGRVLLSLPGALRAVPVGAEETVSVPLTHLVGWQGSLSARVVPLLKGPGGDVLQTAVELSGEGFALIALPVR